jgi:predicted NBD/HSP70 family sugar kinase
MKHLIRQEDTAVDAGHLRRLNLERVLRAAMARDAAFTRAELMSATGLSAPTVGTIACHLIQVGLLTDLGTGPSRGGRRPGRMEFNARHRVVAGIDLGPTRTRLALADLRGEVLVHRVLATPPEDQPADLLRTVARAVQTLMSEAGIQPARLIAVGAGAPGIVNRSRGMVVELAPNLKGWSDVPMGAILREALEAPVVVENDVNLAVLGEHWKGAARGHDTCAFLSFGTGIGAGIMVDGHLHHGAHFLAGQIGFMSMGPQHVETDFGRRGCLESLAGRAVLRERALAVVPDSPAWLGDLFRAVEGGSPPAAAVVDETAALIGMAAANVCSVLDPSLLVLGGSLIAEAPPLIDHVRRIVARAIPTPPTIVPTSLEKDAPLVGSLLIATAEARERLRHEIAERRNGA